MRERAPWIIEATLQTIIAGLLLALLAQFSAWMGQQKADDPHRRLRAYLEAADTKLGTAPATIDKTEVQAAMALIRKDIIRTCFDDAAGGAPQAVERLTRGIALANHFECEVLEQAK